MALHSFGVSSERDSVWNIQVCGEDWIIDERLSLQDTCITPLIEVPYINNTVQDVTLMTAGILGILARMGTFRWAVEKPNAGIGKWRIELLHLLVFISFCRHSPLQQWKQTSQVSNASAAQRQARTDSQGYANQVRRSNLTPQLLCGIIKFSFSGQ